MHDGNRARRRWLVTLLALTLGWLVIQNTTLFALFVWMGSHLPLAGVWNALRFGTLVVALAVMVVSAMVVGAVTAVAVMRGRAAARPRRLEVRHV